MEIRSTPGAEDVVVDNPLRQQVIADMKLAGLAERSRKEYLRHMDQYVRLTWVHPEQAGQTQVAGYLHSAIARGLSAGNFKPLRAALQFLFENTLRRRWDIFKNNRPPRG
jgi:hypothetical protein